MKIEIDTESDDAVSMMYARSIIERAILKRTGETSTPAHIAKLMTILVSLEKKVGKLVPLDEFEDALKKDGFSKLEAFDSIDTLMKNGEVFEPRKGFIQRIT